MSDIPRVTPRKTINPEPESVLFLCTHNSSRSQMAEDLLRARGGIPSAASGSEEEQLFVFRQVRDAIAARIEAFVQEEQEESAQ